MNKTWQPTWTNGEFSTRGWKRRVNRTRYFAAWNNNEAGWPQCVCNACSVISRPPDADHLSLSLSLFHLVLSCSRLSALHENRENPEAWFAFCRASMGIVVVPAASRFVFRSKRATRGLAGWSESENWNLFHNCSFQNYNSCKDCKDLTLTKRWQKSWLRFIYLFIYFSLSKLSWVRRLLFFGLKYNFLKFSVRFCRDLKFFKIFAWGFGFFRMNHLEGSCILRVSIEERDAYTRIFH